MENFEKILAKIVKIVLDIVIAILFVIAIILSVSVIQSNLLNKPYANLFGYSILKVQSGSMEHTLKVGDIIVIKITKDVSENDIITYEESGSLITHRIVEISGEQITTKGDANNAKDEPITKDKVIGKVVFMFNNINIWKKVFLTPRVYILSIITLILFGAAFSIKKEKKE